MGYWYWEYWNVGDKKFTQKASKRFGSLAKAIKYAEENRHKWVQANLWDARNSFSHKQVGYIGTSGKWWNYDSSTGNLDLSRSGKSEQINPYGWNDKVEKLL
jgi:hypothetical protein